MFFPSQVYCAGRASPWIAGLAKEITAVLAVGLSLAVVAPECPQPASASASSSTTLEIAFGGDGICAPEFEPIGSRLACHEPSYLAGAGMPSDSRKCF
jgi:hypothetical protein